MPRAPVRAATRRLLQPQRSATGEEPRLSPGGAGRAGQVRELEPTLNGDSSFECGHQPVYTSCVCTCCLAGFAACVRGNDFFTNLKVVAKKVQGALPIVGLLSRLTAAEGGFDELVSAEPMKCPTLPLVMRRMHACTKCLLLRRCMRAEALNTCKWQRLSMC